MNKKLTSILLGATLGTALTFSLGNTNVMAADYSKYTYEYTPTKVESMKRHYKEVYNEDVQITKGSAEVQDGTDVATGMTLTRGDGSTRTIVLVGDISGEGRISAMDLSLLLQQRKISDLTGAAYQAADMNLDGRITAMDISLLSMELVDFEISRGANIIPIITGEIQFNLSTTEAAKEVQVGVIWPDTGVLEVTKQISLDGGETFDVYTGPVTLDKNGTIVARLLDANGNELKRASYEVNNVDNTAPNDYTITGKATSTVITVEGETTDTAIDAKGNPITDGIAGIAKYEYKLINPSNEAENVDWQEGNEFRHLTPDTEYTIQSRAIDYAGNVKETAAIIVKTLPLISAADALAQGKLTFTYNPAGYTKDPVTVTFGLTEDMIAAGFKTEYQVGEVKTIEINEDGTVEGGAEGNGEEGTGEGEEIQGEWIVAGTYTSEENCKIYVRLTNEEGKAAEEPARTDESAPYVTYAVAEIDKIDNLAPLAFVPTFTRSEDGTTLTVQAHTEDAPATTKSASSGNIEYLYKIKGEEGEEQYSTSVVAGTYYGPEGTTWTSIPEEEYAFTVEADKEYNIVVYAYDKVGNEVRTRAICTTDNFEFKPEALGIGVINTLDANVTVNGAPAAYDNPLIPVGFKAVETPDASWAGVMPIGADDGLVIEDENGNQFVWVPVPIQEGQTALESIDNMMYKSRGKSLLNQFRSTLYTQYQRLIAGEDVARGAQGSKVVTNENEEEVTVSTEEYVQGIYSYRKEVVEEIEKHQGFYIGRYEAGYSNGNLASVAGVMPMSGLSYEAARNYADSMYNTKHVTSGLITGTQNDLLAHWINDRNGWNITTKLDATKGNRKNSTFTHTGKYQVPSAILGEVMSEVQEGEDVSKENGEMQQIATGTVEAFKMNNIYDLYGNVQEYTTERQEVYQVVAATGLMSKTPNYAQVVRGFSYADAAEHNIYDRGIIYDTEDVVNNTGFRVMLYLRESKAVDGNILPYNTTIDGNQAKYNNPIIPAGYKAVNTEAANWGDGTTSAVDWNKGLVIEDADGNQFVWIPVDGTEVAYKKWTSGVGAGISYAAEGIGTDDYVPTGWSDTAQITRYGGFYIARYEGGVVNGAEGEVVAQSKGDITVTSNVSYNEALQIAERMTVTKVNEQEVNNVKVSLITGRQWDTVARWIANEYGEDAVLVDSSLIGQYGQGILTTGQKATNNIYDLAGNAWEWTTENYTTSTGEAQKVYRGGVGTTDSSTAMAYRAGYDPTKFDAGTSFRMALYVNGNVEGIAQLAVDEPERKEPQIAGGNFNSPGTLATGYKENDEVKIKVYPAGLTRENITATIENKTGNGVVEYKLGNGEWTEGTSVEITENTTLSARIKGSNNTVEMNVNWIDREAPKFNDIKAEIIGENVVLSGQITDNKVARRSYRIYVVDGSANVRENKGSDVISFWVGETKEDGTFETLIPLSEFESNKKYHVRLYSEDLSGAVTNQYYENLEIGTVPAKFTPTVSVVDNKVTISAVTGATNGISKYEYYINNALVYAGPETQYIYENTEAGKTYTVFVIAEDTNGGRRISEFAQVATESRFKNGDYVRAKVYDIVANDATVRDEFNRISGKEVTVKIKDINTLELEHTKIFEANGNAHYEVIADHLVFHSDVLGGSGTEADPYVSDGRIKVNIIVMNETKEEEQPQPDDPSQPEEEMYTLTLVNAKTADGKTSGKYKKGTEVAIVPVVPATTVDENWSGDTAETKGNVRYKVQHEYAFNGWSTGSNEWNLTVTVDKDMTITANMKETTTQVQKQKYDDYGSNVSKVDYPDKVYVTVTGENSYYVDYSGSGEGDGPSINTDKQAYIFTLEKGQTTSQTKQFTSYVNFGMNLTNPNTRYTNITIEATYTTDGKLKFTTNSNSTTSHPGFMYYVSNGNVRANNNQGTKLYVSASRSSDNKKLTLQISDDSKVTTTKWVSDLKWQDVK